MERRDNSVTLLNDLRYIDSLDYEEKGVALIQWCEKYMSDDFEKTIDLELSDLQTLSELFYKNINFLKEDKIDLQKQIKQGNSIRKFIL
jgi:hypothetical protein